MIGPKKNLQPRGASEAIIIIFFFVTSLFGATTTTFVSTPNAGPRIQTLL